MNPKRRLVDVATVKNVCKSSFTLHICIGERVRKNNAAMRDVSRYRQMNLKLFDRNNW